LVSLHFYLFKNQQEANSILQKKRKLRIFLLVKDGLILLMKYSKMTVAEMPLSLQVLDSLEDIQLGFTCQNTSELFIQLIKLNIVLEMLL